jgi:CheY-like chemotaxis protein
VDDNATNRQILKEMILSWNMVPTLVDDSLAAISRMSEAARANHPFGIVLLDFMMPGKTGLELAEQVRRTPGIDDTPMLLLTSGGKHGLKDSLQELGIQSVLSKPVRQMELQRALIAAVGNPPSAQPGNLPSPINEDQINEPPISGLNILLAEDNPVNQRVVSIMLLKNGHEVVIVDNGREAVSAWKDGCFDLILMDIQMPEMDGFEALATIRSLEQSDGRHARTRIIALTAHAMKGDRDRCLEAGFDDYLSKPIRAAELSTTLDQLVRSKHQVVADVPSESFDRAFALEQAGGDEALLLELISLLQMKGPEQIDRLKKSLGQNDARAIEQASHLLKGSLSQFAPPFALRPLLDIEQMAKQDRIEEARSLLPAADLMIKRLFISLNLARRELIESSLAVAARSSN